MSQALTTALQNCDEELKTLQQFNDKLKAEVTRLKSTIRVLVEPEELGIVVQSIDQLREQDVEALRESNDQLQIAHETLRQSNGQYRVELDALRQSNDHLKAELEALRRSDHHLKGEVQTLRKVNNELRAELEALRRSEHHLIGKFETLRQANDEPRIELAQLKPTTREVRKLLELVNIGSFHTDEVRPRNRPELQASKEITFETPYPERPSSVLLGLTDIDIGNWECVRIQSHTSDIRNDGFKVHLDTWEARNLHGCGCSWLGVAAGNDHYLQFGRVALDQPWMTVMERFTRQIAFEHEYPFPPVVVVWLSALAMGKTRNWRVKTYASQVTTSGFTLHIDTWAGSHLYGAESTWLAYPTDTPRILSGDFNTLQVRSWHPARDRTTGTVHFVNTFESTPRVFVALNFLDMDCKHNLRFFMKYTADRSKMDWSLNSWHDSMLYTAGASYIAIG
ncbi:hypothetical protein DFP73DRAFT_346555 [Morchella snyderi]|nr:hypothetical protein DFP73DRAFT_346555 [Morchella snyderi]